MLHSAIVIKKKCAIEGKGLFATSLIPEGEVVWKIDEPTYTWAEIQQWPQEKYLRFEKYGFQCGVNRYSLPEGDCREANHSCDPNTWWQGSDTLIARRDIPSGEEVTYDYASCDIDLQFEIACRCGAANCRHVITNRDYLDPNWQQEYGEHLPPHMLAAIAASTAF